MGVNLHGLFTFGCPLYHQIDTVFARRFFILPNHGRRLAGGTHFVCFYGRGIYSLKRAEIERTRSENRILNAIIQTEEKERKRFAKDLHDGLGPLLSAVKMSVSALMNNKTQNQTEILENTNMVINEAITSIKEISNNLSPHVLTNFGLVSAIKNFTHKINQTRSVTINVFLATGARYESDKIAGAAHFIEHVCFKGTPSYPTPRELATAIECVGGSLNGGTDKAWLFLYKYGRLIPFVEAVYGNSAYVFCEDNAKFDIYVTTSGYIIKKAKGR